MFEDTGDVRLDRKLDRSEESCYTVNIFVNYLLQS